MSNKIPAIKVSQLNNYVSRRIQSDSNIQDICIIGEVSGFKSNRNGHAYFTLKDEKASIACFFPASLVNFSPAFEDGMEVVLKGNVTLYVPTRRYTFSVTELLPSKREQGKMAEALNLLKAKLSSEGIFDPANKKKIPFFPNRVAIISSKNAAGYQDIMEQIRNKNNFIDIDVYPVWVQGIHAAESICKAITAANQKAVADLIIIARGGGSKEDLASFNDEKIVRSIFNSKIPVVAAIGHKQDQSLADMAADYSAITPTASVELIPDIGNIKENILNMIMSVKNSTRIKLEMLERELETYKNRLENAHPKNIISRGFGAILNEEGRQVFSVKELKKGEKIEIMFNDGSVFADVTDIVVSSKIN